MNLLLLDERDITDRQAVTLGDHRFEHCRRVLKCRPGDRLSIGLLNGCIGHAVVTDINDRQIKLVIEALDQPPPSPLPLTVIMALPRPQVLKRITHNIAEFGIKNLHLIHCDKVEKSYWQSKNLEPAALDAQLRAGLMQCKDTVMPDIRMHRDFNRFVSSVLPDITEEAETFLAHPYAGQALPESSNVQRAVIIGPEGGFSQREIECLEQDKVIAVSMGARIYRVESAMTLLAGKLSMTPAVASCATTTMEKAL